TRCINSPSNRITALNVAPQSLSALAAIVSKTGCTSVGELLMTRRISAVAFCCSCASALSLSASAKRFSRSGTLALSSLGDLRPTGGLASLDFVGFGPWRIGLSLPPYESAGDRLRRTRQLGQVG